MLTVTQMLRKKGVVGKFVEFYGPGLAHLSLEDMATIANMAPEYGATCGFFPINAETIAYLKGTARACRAGGAGREIRQGAGHVLDAQGGGSGCSPTRCRSIWQPSCPPWPGPSARRTVSTLTEPPPGFAKVMADEFKKAEELGQRFKVENANFDLGHGDVVIAAITSCTNTSNP